MVALRRKIWNDCRILMVLRAVVISSEVERSPLQTDERRELENRKTQHEDVFPCRGRSDAKETLCNKDPSAALGMTGGTGVSSSPVSSHSAPLIPGHASLLSNFRVRGSGFRVVVAASPRI